ncbi:very short patch repair endonuclease [Rathayibacter oskolensis]|uniref:very short patch repair endonuclease n=1 Tax=Rathayibacter oskolensis TaxID=1891671 RepID=UPI00265EE517|nr:very short patch repair endonuclease [Rathayibacter oskolensis]WKK73202.1 very short patch repair endonuclease [Rathayibacter oskolensis]
MLSNRGRDTKVELRVRSGLHAAGLRYRLQVKVPGSSRRTIDVAFPKQRIAVFLDGCFWHGCPVHHTVSKTNAGFWAEKVATNRERDQDTDRLLREAGWVPLRFWEHEEVDAIVLEVAASVARRRADPEAPISR